MAAVTEDPAALRDDAEALERAADVIRRRIPKPDRVKIRVVIKVLEDWGASMRRRANR